MNPMRTMTGGHRLVLRYRPAPEGRNGGSRSAGRDQPEWPSGACSAFLPRTDRPVTVLPARFLSRLPRRSAALGACIAVAAGAEREGVESIHDLGIARISPTGPAPASTAGGRRYPGRRHHHASVMRFLNLRHPTGAAAVGLTTAPLGYPGRLSTPFGARPRRPTSPRRLRIRRAVRAGPRRLRSETQ